MASVNPTTINVCTNVTHIFDQVAAAPRDVPILLQIECTPLPLSLFNFLLPAAGADNKTPSSSVLAKRIMDTTLLINKICEMLFLHPAGAIASIFVAGSGKRIITPSEAALAATSQSFCSGPLLAFAAACAYRCAAPAVTFWFGDVNATSLVPYGGLTHTVREWFGPSLSVPLLVAGIQIPVSRLASIASSTTNSLNIPAPSAEAIRVLNALSRPAWQKLVDPAVLLQIGY